MSYWSEAKEILYRFLANLEAKERKEMLLLASRWSDISSMLDEKIQQLAEKGALTENQLYRLSIYQELLIEAKKQVNKYSLEASEIIAEHQNIFLKAGLESTQEVIGLLNVKFQKLNVDAVNVSIGYASDGTKLYDLLNKSYPETVTKLTRTLIESTALGRNPRLTAKLMKDDMNGNLTRALRIARTEQMMTLREASIIQMRESGVVKEWQWLIENDEIVCDHCISMNGKRFPLSQSMDTHPNCRCCQLPIIK